MSVAVEPELRFPKFNAKWKPYALKDISKTITSGSRGWAKFYSDTGSLFLRMTNLPREGISLLLDDTKYVSVSATEEGSRTAVAENDILMSITAELGKIGLVPSGLGTSYVNQHTALIKTDAKLGHPAFIANALATKASNKRLNRLNDSGAKSALNLNTVKDFKVTAPTLPEQKKIATFLWAVDEKLAALETQLASWQEFKRAMMQALFTQSLRFKADDGSSFSTWEEIKLGDIISLSTASSKSPYLKNGGQYGVADMGSVSRSGRLQISKATDEAGDLLAIGELIMPKDDIGGGNIIGRVARIDVDESYVLSDHVYCLTPTGADSKFLQFAINSFEVNKSFRRKANGTAQLSLSKKAVLEQLIKLPSLLEQKKIASYLSSLDAKTDALSDRLASTHEFKRGLLQKMFV